MRLIANGTQPTGGPSLPTRAAASGTPNYAYNGAPGSGAPTVLDPDTFNILLAEFISILSAAGVSPDNTGANVGQVLAALRILFGVGTPLVARSSTGVSLTSGYSGTVSVTFTAPAAGYVMVHAGLNLNQQASSTVVGSLTINSGSVAADTTLLSQTQMAVQAVTAGESVTVAYTVSAAAATGATGTYFVSALFVP